MFKKKYIRWLLLILLLLAVLWAAGIFLRPEGAMEEPQGEPAPEEEQGTVQEAPEEEEWIPAEEQVITQEDIDSNYALCGLRERKNNLRSREGIWERGKCRDGDCERSRHGV